MDKWNEIRTAYKLAQLGTLSATAQAIGVHRSTVMRHIDSLEETLGITLFQRNDKGYIPTEAGVEVMRLGEVTDCHFSQLSSRLKSQEQTLEGTITITIVNEMASLVMPSIKTFQRLHPKMHVDLIGDIRNFNLEYGEADIAIRSGVRPTTPDNVVLPLLNAKLVLCAHQDYIDEYGLPEEQELFRHRFVAMKARPAHLAWNEWIHEHVEHNIVVLASSQHIVAQAIMTGCGIGVLPQQTVRENAQMREIPLGQGWDVAIWILVHRDLYAMPKIREFLAILQQQNDWPITLR